MRRLGVWGASTAMIGLSIWALRDAPAAIWLWSALLGALLIAIASEDWRSMMISDALSLPLIGAGLVFAALWPTTTFANHLIGSAIGFAFFWSVDRLYRRIRGRVGLGEGDALVFAGAGAWLGVAALPSVALLAAVCGFLVAVFARSVGSADDARATVQAGAIPFGPPLCLAIWVVWLTGPLFSGGDLL